MSKRPRDFQVDIFILAFQTAEQIGLVWINMFLRIYIIPIQDIIYIDWKWIS